MQWVKKLYDWTLSFANHPGSVLFLAFLAFTESSFFIIPPDVLLIALCAGNPNRSFYFAIICTVGSVLGGLFGYVIGAFFFNSLGSLILVTLNLEKFFVIVQNQYQNNVFLTVFMAAFTPIPFKVFTLAAGFFKVGIFEFVMAAIFGRGLRFFLVAFLLYLFGEKVKVKIEKHFNLLTWIFGFLFIAGFLFLRFLQQK